MIRRLGPPDERCGAANCSLPGTPRIPRPTEPGGRQRGRDASRREGGGKPKESGCHRDPDAPRSRSSLRPPLHLFPGTGGRVLLSRRKVIERRSARRTRAQSRLGSPPLFWGSPPGVWLDLPCQREITQSWGILSGAFVRFSPRRAFLIRPHLVTVRRGKSPCCGRSHDFPGGEG